MDINKILVCVDLTPLSLKALEWAKFLAQKLGAELVVFHELEDVYTMIKTSASFGVPASPDLKEKAEKNVIDKITPLLKECENYKIIVEAKGKTADRLIDIVSSEEPELTVITTDYDRIITKLKSQVLVIK